MSKGKAETGKGRVLSGQGIEERSKARKRISKGPEWRSIGIAVAWGRRAKRGKATEKKRGAKQRKRRAQHWISVDSFGIGWNRTARARASNVTKRISVVCVGKEKRAEQQKRLRRTAAEMDSTSERQKGLYWRSNGTE